MSDLNERELDLKDYLYYAFKEFSPKGGIWMKYLEHWDEAYTQLVKIVEGHFSMEEDVVILRKFMWVNHGCSPHALYGDDGEMQCGNCLLDFKRMPIKELNKSIVKERIKRMRANQEQSTEPVQVDEDTKNVIDNLVGVSNKLLGSQIRFLRISSNSFSVKSLISPPSLLRIIPPFAPSPPSAEAETSAVNTPF